MYVSLDVCVIRIFHPVRKAMADTMLMMDVFRETLIIYVHREEVRSVCGELTSFNFCPFIFLHVIDISLLIGSWVRADRSLMSGLLDNLKSQ